MDLSKYNLTNCADRGAVLTVTNPVTGEPDAETTITCRGINCTDAQKVIAANRKRGSTKTAKASEDDDVKQAIEVLAACIISWSGIERDGVLLDCTPENVREVLSNPGNVWLLKQLNTFVLDETNFFPSLDKD